MKLRPVDELQEESILKNSFGKSVAGELTSKRTLLQTISELWCSLDSSELGKLLQSLPLAINQAGSYCERPAQMWRST